MAFQPSKAERVRLKGRYLASRSDLPRQPDAVEPEMGADIPAAPSTNVSLTQIRERHLEFRFVRASPIGGPGKQCPTGSLGDACADTHWPDAKRRVPQQERNRL